MGIPNKEWDDLPSPGIMFLQTSSQEVLNMEPITDEFQGVFSRNKRNTKIMCVRDTILASSAEAGIDEDWCLLDNQSVCNAFINVKYLSKTRDDTDVKHLCFHWNSGVTYTNNIGELPGYSNPVWYNLKGIANILSLWLLQKNHIVTYKSQYGNEFFVHIPHQPTLNITKNACQKNIICRKRVFCTYIVWWKLPHLHLCWRHLWHVYTNVWPFVTWSYECQNIPWWESNQHRMPYINTVWYYWQKICADGQLILSITFLNLIYLTDY